MQTLRYTVIMYEATHGQPGLITTHKSKEIMCSLFNEKLDHDAVHIHKSFVTSTGNPKKMISDLCTQVQNYNIIYAVPDKMQHFQSSKKTYSGKHHVCSLLSAFKSKFILLTICFF